jgi:predicted nucleic acid-binding protein
MAWSRRSLPTEGSFQSSISMGKGTVIIDTSVLVDMLAASTGRRPEFVQLLEVLLERQQVIRIPMHAVFELHCALGKGLAEGRLRLERIATEERSLRFDPVPIDETFVMNYMREGLPRIKTGDYIFLAMAYIDKCQLVTEDAKLAAAAKKLGVAVFSAGEYLKKLDEE